MTFVDHFAADGKTRPFYGLYPYPAAMYAAATDVSWFAWESFFGSARVIKVRTYNHTTDVWTAAVTIGSHSLHNDDHGVPSLCRDADGYVHAFFGAHDSNLLEYVTNAADNPAAWTLQTTFANDVSYARPVLVGSTMYLFVRDRDAGAFERNLAIYVTTGITAGVPTWDAVQELVTFGFNSRVYTSNPILDGTDIHLSATLSDYSDTSRVHQFYFIYDTTDGSVRNASGSVTVASGSLPINLATANASFRVFESVGGTSSDVAAHCLDASGDPHIVYLERTGSGTTLKHRTFTGGAWSSPVTAATLPDVTRISNCLLARADGSVELFHDEDNAEDWVSGGNIQRVIRSGGVWGSPATILAATSYALGNPSVVRDGHADARIVFGELTVGSSDSSGGNLKCYAYGDSGFLQSDIGIGPIPPVDDPDPDFADVIFLMQGRP